MYNYMKIGTYGMGCNSCGRCLEPDDEVAICPDCGAILCKSCVESGEFDNHKCEDDEE